MVGHGPGTLELHAAGCAGAYGGFRKHLSGQTAWGRRGEAALDFSDLLVLW